jgi:hypothetical protein
VLFAGLAAHSFLSLDEPLSAAAGMLALTGHTVGWPIPRGGSQFTHRRAVPISGKIRKQGKESSPVESLAALPGYDLILCDVTPRQLLKLAGQRLSDHYKNRLQNYRYGPVYSKWTTLCTRQFRGKLPIACAQPPYTWAEVLRRSLPRSGQFEMDGTRIVHSFCWRSRACSILREPHEANTPRGLIAMFPTDRTQT